MSPLRSAVFLHTQKTAGTSIVAMARDLYGLDQVISHGDWLIQKYETYKDKRFISGHFGYHFAEPLIAERYAFTFLRNPVDRLLSLYRFCQAQSNDAYPIYAAARRMPLEEFLAFGSDVVSRDGQKNWSKTDYFECHESIWNNQAWQLAHGWTRDLRKNDRHFIIDMSPTEIARQAKANLDAFDYVGFMETFDEDVPAVLRNLGCTSPPTLPKENVSQGGPQLEDLPASTLSLLKRATEIDQDVYDYAWSRFSKARSLRFRRRVFWHGWLGS